MYGLAIVLLITTFQTTTPGSDSGLTALAGRWISTVTPGPGEAPAIAPSFTVEERNGRLFITFPRDREQYAATVFAASKTESLMIVKTPGAGGATRTFVIRPDGVGRVRLELFNEYPDGRRQENFYYSEVFKRAR